MSARSKVIPAFPKILLAYLVLMIVYGVSHHRQPAPDGSSDAYASTAVHAASNLEGPSAVGGAEDGDDRQTLPETSIYVEDNGTQHELPTRPYYFRDHNSGRIVASDIADPPNDGRDYDPLLAQE